MKRPNHLRLVTFTADTPQRPAKHESPCERCFRVVPLETLFPAPLFVQDADAEQCKPCRDRGEVWSRTGHVYREQIDPVDYLLSQHPETTHCSPVPLIGSAACEVTRTGEEDDSIDWLYAAQIVGNVVGGLVLLSALYYVLGGR